MLLGGAFLAVSPDLDFFFVFNLHLDENWHRGFTHSIFFAFMVTCLLLLGTGFSHVRSVMAGGAALVSHGILDFLTTAKGMGVELFFPFSDKRMSLGIFGVSEFNDGFYPAEMIKSGLIELSVFLPIFLIAAFLTGYLSPAVLKRTDN